jgi:hypothetical protein
MDDQQAEDLARQSEDASCRLTTDERVQASGEARFWRWTAVGLWALALGKGLREPNTWAYTQAQLDYRFGFIRRGLLGELLGHPLGLNHYMHFAVLSTALLLFLFGLLALLAHRSGVARWTPPGELLAVYASSYSVSYLAHMNGYLDVPLALLCVGPLLVRSTGWRLAAAVGSTMVGILIHEQFFFAFLPLLIVSVLLAAATAKTSAERRLAWGGGILLVVVGVSLTLYCVRHGSVSEVQSEQIRQSVQQETDHPVNVLMLTESSISPRKNMEIMRSVWHRSTFIPAQVESLLMFAPTAAVLSWATLVLLRRWRPRRYRWIYAGVLFATLAPLSLHLMGWDKSRWNELLSLNAFLLLLVVSQQMGDKPVQLPVRLRRACLVVMLLNMATGGSMLDNRHIRPFPLLRNPDGAIVESAQ